MTQKWSLKGEGRANLVFGYAGSDTKLRGKTLRVAKIRAAETEPGAEEVERNVWRGTALAEETEKLQKGVTYVHSILAPYLGRHLIEQGYIVDVPAELSENYGVATQGLLLHDKTLFTEEEGRGWTGEGRVISVEIKPKCGFVPDAKTMDPSHDFKRVFSRFSLHQYLKLKQGKEEKLSQYSPMDMFSGNVTRMHQALLELMQAPQNNLAMFLDGERLPITEDGLMNTSVTVALQKVLRQLPVTQTSSLPSLFSRIIAQILHREGALDRILDLQKLDRYDIEGIYPLYCTLRDRTVGASPPLEQTASPIARPGKVLRNCVERRGRAVACEHTKAHTALKRLPEDAQLSLLRDWLISATAKDCSVFVTLRVVQKPSDSEKQNVRTSFPRLWTVEDETEFQILYKVQMSDLDLKPVTKIPYQFRLDKEILNAFVLHQDKNSL